MPVTKAAAKAARRNEKRRAKNRPIKDAMKTGIKAVIKTKEQWDSIPADMVSIAYSKIDKALKAGILKKKTAARRKAKVAKIANQ